MCHLQAMGAAEREGPVQGRLYRSLKLWTFYCDLEESLGTPESTRAAYDRIMELRIATPQIILNYAAFLQVPFFSLFWILLDCLTSKCSKTDHPQLCCLPSGAAEHTSYCVHTLCMYSLCSIAYTAWNDIVMQYIVYSAEFVNVTRWLILP